MKADKKSLNKKTSYKKTGLMMLAYTAAGAVIGFLSVCILNGKIGNIESGMTFLLEQLQRTMLPLLSIITAASVILGEINIRRQKMIGRNLLEAQDEECDRWEYEEEKTGAWGMIVNILSQILCILILSAGYSYQYIADGNHINMIASCLVFLVCYAYCGFWQTRYVKITQKNHPEKQGDMTSRNFQQQWLDSCDEAEKELIYQSAYKSYIQTSIWIPILLIITMLGHLFFNTGIMAVVVVAAIWLVLTVSYLRSCVSLKGAKLRE